MAKKNLANILTEKKIDNAQIINIFHNVLDTDIDNLEYRDKLTRVFTYALEKDITLFPAKSIGKITDNSDTKKIIEEYLKKWCSGYVMEKDNPSLKKPLKNFGEKDNALIERLRSATAVSEEVLQYYVEGHFLMMSAENMNGKILEEYLAYVLEDYGWIWCAGETLRACDFFYQDNNGTILLQIKNKYNTENSSSSAIREGTTIKKWNRLSRPKVATGKFNPLPNWDELQKIIDNPMVSSLLTEEKYLEYISQNTSTEIQTLN